MCVIIKSRPEFKMGHVGSKTRSLGQFLEKPCVLSRRHSFDPVFMKLCQNDFLTLNKRLSRRAMLSDDSSCFLSPSLWRTARHGLKYCLKGSLSPKQPISWSRLYNRFSHVIIFRNLYFTAMTAKTSFFFFLYLFCLPDNNYSAA